MYDCDIELPPSDIELPPSDIELPPSDIELPFFVIACYCWVYEFFVVLQFLTYIDVKKQASRKLPVHQCLCATPNYPNFWGCNC